MVNNPFVVIISIILISLVVAFSIAMFAQAQIEDTITVPFDYNGRLCGPLENGNWVCEWDPNRINLNDTIDNGTDSVPEPTSAQTTLCPDRFELQDDLVTCLPIIKELEEHDEPDPLYTDPKMQPFIDILENYERQPPQTYDDLEEQWRIENLMKCWYGLNQGRGIQTENYFITSSFFSTSGTAKAQEAAIIDKAMEECKAQKIMLTLLGDDRQVGDVRSRQGWYGMIDQTHTERADKVPVWTQDRANQEANIGIDSSKDICDVKHISAASREFLGCNPTVLKVNINAVVTIQSDVEDKWLQYLKDDGDAQAKEIRANKIAEYNARINSIDTPVVQNTSTANEIRDIESKGWNLYPESERPNECFNDSLDKLEYLKRCGN